MRFAARSFLCFQPLIKNPQNSFHTLQNLCHFKAVFFQRAAMCTLAWLERSGACHWERRSHDRQSGWPDESLLDLDCPARPSAEKGVVAWGFLTNCVGKARKHIFIPRFHESLTTHANIPLNFKTENKRNEIR